MYRLCAILVVVCLGACSERDLRPGVDDPPDRILPSNNSTGDMGLDLARDVGIETCFVTATFAGAVSGERQYPSSPGSSCTVQRTDGLIVITGENPLLFDSFSVAIQLLDRGSTRISEEDSGPRFEVDEGEGDFSSWSGITATNCDVNVDLNEQIGGDRYRMLGTGSCLRSVKPAVGSADSSQLRFVDYTFGAEYDWP